MTTDQHLAAAPGTLAVLDHSDTEEVLLHSEGIVDRPACRSLVGTVDSRAHLYLGRRLVHWDLMAGRWGTAAGHFVETTASDPALVGWLSRTVFLRQQIKTWYGFISGNMWIILTLSVNSLLQQPLQLVTTSNSD